MYRTQKVSKKRLFKPFLRACGPLRGGGSESESDLEPDWDSEPDRAGRGFSFSESLSAIFFSDPDPESESELDEAFCVGTDGKSFRGKKNLQKPRHVASQSRWITFFFPLPPAFFAPRPPAFFSGVKSCRRMRSVSDQGPIGSCVCVCGSTWSLFLPESESDGVGSDSDGDPLSASRSLEEPPRTFFGGGGR